MKSSLFLTLCCLIVACTTPKNSDTQQQSILANPILVDLRGKVAPKTVVAGLQKYELAIVKEADKSENKWVFTYNPALITADEMLRILKYEQWCEDARFYEKK